MSVPLPEWSRLHTIADAGPPVDDEMFYAVVDVLDDIAAETAKSVPQIALNWLLNGSRARCPLHSSNTSGRWVARLRVGPCPPG
jgi:aryl-alcohol dehydrogenase-like predicted oxidoreductase